ncbi:hypothetical protein [Spirosoma sp. 48-14]|uniref:hypothetical protein n=1 Tax=Spirosoma sp. 48-14 TaxID=1895854 RepID=UPI0009605DDB|nr:hypothetical protein [Spirosoma sp. 48-14]OJW78434.1 MAG: hypothetical protein BGO59_31010 [Spirosoma sp. 48-14]
MLSPNDDIVAKADVKALRAAVYDDQRHRLHAESATSEAAASPYFKRWVREFVTPVITSASKRRQVLKQMVWPPVTVELVDEIVDMASAVHHAEDRFVKLDFTDASLEADWNAYAERAGIWQFITRNCHSALFSRPNSLVVVDLPKVQTTDFPEPYVYLLPLERVRAMKALNGPSDSGLLEFVWFDTDQKDVTALFDTVDISFWKNDGNGKWVQVGEDIPHNQPICPVFKMWDDVEDSNPLTSNTMLRPVLGWLDRLMFWDSGGESNDLAAAFLMFWYYEATKKQEPASQPTVGLSGPKPGVLKGGKMIDGKPYTPKDDKGGCDEEDKESIYGPGTKLGVPAPLAKDEADLRPPAGWIAAPIDNLEYIANKVVNIRQRVRQTATGYDGGASGQPMNERQIMQILERSRIIYNYLAEHYEVLTKRVLEVFGRYRYGPYFVGATVSLGRRVSMLTGDQLIALYQTAKDAGLGAWLLEELTLMQQEYFARTDASRKLRYKVLRDLDTYSNYSPDELYNLGINTSDPEGYAISVGLMGFVYRFEREADILIEQFCNAPDYDNRISQIKTSFKRYVSEQKPIQPNPANDPNAPGNNPGKSGNSNPGNGRKRKPANPGT